MKVAHNVKPYWHLAFISLSHFEVFHRSNFESFNMSLLLKYHIYTKFALFSSVLIQDQLSFLIIIVFNAEITRKVLINALGQSHDKINNTVSEN